MHARIFLGFILSVVPVLASGQTSTQPPSPLQRHYREGETLVYRMNGVNESWHYSVCAKGIVKKNPSGAYIEEFRWTNMTSDGKPYTMAPAMTDFRQKLSLDPGAMPSPPDMTKADPKLVGPILDMGTFYVDLWLAAKTGQMTHPGDHFYFPMGTPGSWADGTHVLVGMSSVDFDFTMKSVDTAAGTVTLEVKHVPPQKPQIPLPASWMQTPVADTQNNWVQVVKQPDGKFLGGVGQETFTVELKVSRVDGKIITGSMDNVVKSIFRTCGDQALTQCSAPETHEIVRKIEITLEPQRP